MFADFSLFSEAEITRRPVDDLVLQMKDLNIDKVKQLNSDIPVDFQGISAVKLGKRLFSFPGPAGGQFSLPHTSLCGGPCCSRAAVDLTGGSEGATTSYTVIQCWAACFKDRQKCLCSGFLGVNMTLFCLRFLKS